MSGFTGSPRVLRGALVGTDPFHPPPSVIVFQYNPDTMTRRLVAQAAGDRPAQAEALRLKGPPQETITLTVEIDAADQLERADPLAVASGLHPTLAALEMLLYPKSANVIANNVLAAVGMIEVVPPEAPLTLFIWGVNRVLPVRLTDFSVTEEAYDPALNPIRAKVGLGLRVLTYDDLGLTSAGGSLFMAHQVMKEVLATLGSVIGSAGTLSASLSL